MILTLTLTVTVARRRRRQRPGARDRRIRIFWLYIPHDAAAAREVVRLEAVAGGRRHHGCGTGWFEELAHFGRRGHGWGVGWFAEGVCVRGWVFFANEGLRLIAGG